MTLRRASTRSWSRGATLLTWEDASVAWEGASEVGVDWAEEMAGCADAVIEVVGFGFGFCCDCACG